MLPRSATFRKYDDQIEQCCAAAKKYGLEVHVWKVNFNLSTAPKDFASKLRREGRTQVSVRGKPSDWLCPSHPDNQKLELESMLEVVQKYPIDGLHLDYIRYPNAEHCYCDGCRRRFEAQSGQNILDRNWPQECYSGPRKEEYNQWRCRQITSLVAAISCRARRLRSSGPDRQSAVRPLKISAAVYGSYPSCRESVAQDWPKWVEAGHLDFVCPMNYTADSAQFASLIKKQQKLLAGRAPLYVGIGAASSKSKLTAAEVAGQIELARQLGAEGFVIFDFNAQTAAGI